MDVNLNTVLTEIDIFKILLKFIYTQGYCIAHASNNQNIEIFTESEFLEAVEELNQE